MTCPSGARAVGLFPGCTNSIRPWCANHRHYFDVRIWHRPRKIVDLAMCRKSPSVPPTCAPAAPTGPPSMRSKRLREGMDAIHPTDIGCYTLGFLPPLSMADFLICMGSSVGLRPAVFPRPPTEGGLLYRRFHLFSFRHSGPCQRRVQQPQLHPGDPGQRHHRHDRPPAPSRCGHGQLRIEATTKSPSKRWCGPSG
jgi:hypothetical protein